MALDIVARGMAANAKIDAAVFKYRGTVSTYGDLPSTAEVGDVYNIANADPQHDINAGDNVAWDGTGWDKLGGDVDLSNYLAKDNTTPFTPSSDYNPAVKKYVDDAITASQEVYYIDNTNIDLTGRKKGVYILKSNRFPGSEEQHGVRVFGGSWIYRTLVVPIVWVYDDVPTTAPSTSTAIASIVYTDADGSISRLEIYSNGYIPIPFQYFCTTGSAQTITGLKTFSTLPESSVVPTTNNQLANKKYVDDTVTYRPYLAGFDTTHTTQDFLDSIEALNLPVGMAYLGQVSLSDMPDGISVQAEVEVFIYPQNVIYCVMRSAEVSPYEWSCNSYDYRGWEAIDATANNYTDAAIAALGLDDSYRIIYVTGADVETAMNTKGVEILDAMNSGKTVLIMAKLSNGNSTYFDGLNVISNIQSTSETTGTFNFNPYITKPVTYDSGSTFNVSFNSYNGSSCSYTVSGSGDQRTVSFRIGYGSSGYNLTVLSAKPSGSDSYTYYKASYKSQPVSRGYLEQVANIPYIITEDATDGFYTDANKTTLTNIARSLVDAKRYSSIDIISPVIYLKYYDTNADGSKATGLSEMQLHFHSMSGPSNILNYSGVYTFYFYSDQKETVISKKLNNGFTTISEGYVSFIWYWSLNSNVILPGTSTGSNANSYKPHCNIYAVSNQRAAKVVSIDDYANAYFPTHDSNPATKLYVDTTLNELDVDKTFRYYGHTNSLPTPGTRSGSVISPVYTVSSDMHASLYLDSDISSFEDSVAALGGNYYFGVHYKNEESIVTNYTTDCVLTTDYPEIIDGVAFSESESQPDYILVHVNASAAKPAKYSRGRYYDTGSKSDASDFSVYMTDGGTAVASNDITEPSWVSLPIIDYEYVSEYNQQYSLLLGNLPHALELKACALTQFPKSVLNGTYTYETANIAATVADSNTDNTTFNYNVGMAIFKWLPGNRMGFATYNYTLADNAVYSLGDKNALYVLDKDLFESGSNNYWVQLSKPDNSAALDNIAPAYDNTSTYTEGDYVIYNEVLYVCNTDILVAEDFDSTKWTQTTVAELLGNIKSLLGGI